MCCTVGSVCASGLFSVSTTARDIVKERETSGSKRFKYLFNYGSFLFIEQNQVLVVIRTDSSITSCSHYVYQLQSSCPPLVY